MRLDIAMVRRQIENLLISHPELMEDEVLRADMIEGETDAHKFLSSIEERRTDAEDRVEALDARMTKIAARKARYERREIAMRNLMFKILEAANIRKLELPEATLSIRNGTQKVIITDESLLPDHLCDFKRVPDKAAIKSRLSFGPPLSGAELSNAEEILTIRTK